MKSSMVDYKDTKIYYIQVGTYRYYGHTAQKYLKMRESGHKHRLKTGDKRPLYQDMRLLGMSPADIKCIWIENFPCNSCDEARAREQYWIETCKSINNKNAYRSEDAAKAYQKHMNCAYYYNNHEKMLEKNRKYHAENRETLIIKKREKRLDNRDEKNAIRRAAKWECPHCCTVIAKDGKARHLKRKHSEKNVGNQ